MPGKNDTAPLLLLDIDGVISLFGFDHGSPPRGFPANVDGIPHWLSLAAAEHVVRLSSVFACVWCSGWEEKANDHLPHHLGIGPFPYLRLAPPGARRHWKLEAIDTYCGPDRAVAWVDDVLDAECITWAAERPGPTLLVATEPPVGLDAGHVEELEAWAASVAPAV